MRLALVLFCALAAAPWLPWSSDFVLALLARVMVWGLAALSLDLILGAGGMVSFGHAAFLAIGAYAVAIADASDRNDLVWVLPAALLASGGFALASGAVALRTRGVNFIMITLAFAQMVFFGAGSLAEYGGDDGYSLIARTRLLGFRLLDGRAYYWSCLAALIVGYVLCRTVVASRFGRVLRGVRQNPVRMQAMGFDPFAVRLVAYVIGAMLCAVAGVLLVNGAEFASPAYGAWQRSGDLLIMVILGGAGSLHGAILGAAAVLIAEDGLARLTEHWRLIFGPLLVIAVLTARGGLARVGVARG